MYLLVLRQGRFRQGRLLAGPSCNVGVCVDCIKYLLDLREACIDAVEKIEKQVIDRIDSREKEKPIKYFAIPDFAYCVFRVGVVTKISNNGTTYVFGYDPEILKGFGHEYDKKPIKI